MPIPLLARTLLACASLVAAPALAQSFSCPELRAVLAEADRDFASSKGRQLKKENAADFARANGLPAGKLDIKYQRLVHEANKPLTGPVTGCQVVDAYLEDKQSTLRQSSFECRYEPGSSVSRITPALRKQLHDCVGGEVDSDSDGTSLVIYVDRVESGEGMRGVSVELETNPADGATLSVRKSVCVRKTPAGCDDE
ncbi:MAG: hypothetical protein M9907_13690 [Burkholderiaceae bacterium]|nr:hypothetical protein [Burkholderiaceae bacterium]